MPKLEIILKNMFITCVSGFIVCSLILLALDIMNRTMYPGCKVLAQVDDVLVIELDEEIFTGTDYSCLQAAKLIKSICMDGYRVFVWDRVIDLEEANKLIEYGGGPVPLDYSSDKFKDYEEYLATE